MKISSYLQLLNKIYEKVILCLIIIVFIISLLWLYKTQQSTIKENFEGTSISANKYEYTPIDLQNYNGIKYISNSTLWTPSLRRNIDIASGDYIPVYTDFMLPFKIARSNADGAKNKLIPYKYYELGKCPITGKDISLVSDIIVSDNLDTDQDGIPDVVEKIYGMNPKDPSDINKDIDLDSFSNIREYEFDKNSVIDKEIHPPLIERISLQKIANTEISFNVKKIVKHGDDPEKWDIQCEIYFPDKGWRTKFLRIGNSFTADGVEYKITNIIEKIEEKLDPGLGLILEHDMSQVIIEDKYGNKITAKVGKPVYEPNRRITLLDNYTGDLIDTRINNIIPISNNNGDPEKYVVKSVDPDKNIITFERDGNFYNVDENSNYIVPIK